MLMTENSIPRVMNGKVFGQVDATRVPRYAGLGTFARLPQIDEVSHVDVAILGIPFDAGVSYRPGARFGPSHVRESSRMLRPYNPATGAEPFGAQQVVDAGDIAANPFDIQSALKDIENGSRALLERAKRLVTIGGDHTIALPLLRTMAAKYGPISVVHFDAHLDTWDSYFGADYTHGTPFRRASEEGLIDREGSIHVGIRGPVYSAKDLDQDKSLGFEIFSTIEFDDLGVKGAIEKVQARVQDRPMYVSIDIDVLDPAHAPGTGTPEAGGLTSRELLAVIRSFADMNIVGADVVEVAPAYDHAQLTGIAASHVIFELLSAMVPTT
jgi:agmatinase